MPDKIPTFRPPGSDRRSSPVPGEDDPHRAFLWSPRWRKFRAWFLRTWPICGMSPAPEDAEGRVEGCGRPANVVHHLLDRRVREDLALTKTNCQAVCKGCHDRETRRRMNEAKNDNP